MNKKIWIGLASIFLILVLVLGIQSLNQGNKAEQGQDGQAIIDQDQDQEEREINRASDSQANLETVEIVENPRQADAQVEPAESESESEAEKETPQGSEQTSEPKTPNLSPTESSQEASKIKDKAKYITLSVSVKTLLDKKDLMNQEKVELVPEDGWIFHAQKVEFYEGESAFNVLLREMKKNKIHMEYLMTPIYNSNYIKGIGNIYEFDCGELSGWVYSVNDISPSLGATNYILKDGDSVKLLYTCDLGRDLGFYFNE